MLATLKLLIYLHHNIKQESSPNKTTVKVEFYNLVTINKVNQRKL